MKPVLTAALTAAVFRYGFKASWKVTLLAAGAVFAVGAMKPVQWKRKDENLTDVQTARTFPVGALNADNNQTLL